MSRKKTQRARRWRRRLGVWWASGLVVAVVALLAALFVYGEVGGGRGADFKPQIAETHADPSKGEPFEGGPRLHSPVEEVDLGRVPFRTEVSYAFALANVGDAPLGIEDVQVTMLEGC